MDARGSITRLRWRRRGAWMWPAFVAATALDTVIAHTWPSDRDEMSAGDALVVSLVVNVSIVAALSRLAGVGLRRVRRDLPAVVARDLAATALLALVLAGVLVAGLAHRPEIDGHRAMLRDAIVRAQAYIGTHAPAPYRRNLDRVDTVTIEPGLYRTCVPDAGGMRHFCVVVRSDRPLAASVTFAGSESNATFMSGAG